MLELAPRKKRGRRRGTVRAHRILRLQVEGGFLHGLSLDFSPDLNCLIGGRGAGKTTAFELLRWTLKAPLEAGLRPERREHQRLLQHNLGEGGKVRVLIETKDGLRYTVERGLHGEPQILDEAGMLTDLKLTHGVIFDLDVYSQNEIESIAESPAEQLALLDRLVGGEMRQVQERIRAVRARIGENTHAIHNLTKEVAELEAGIAELPLLQAKLSGLRAEETGDPSEFDAAVAEQSLRERESRAIEAAEQFLKSPRDALARMVRALAEGYAAPHAVARGPNRELFQEVTQALEGASEEARLHLVAITAALEKAGDAIRSTRRALEKRHRVSEAHYREVMAQDERERGRAQEQLQLERRLHELEERQRVRDERQAALAAARAERQQHLAAFSDLRDERFALRDAVARSLSEELAPEIEVSVSQGEDRSAFRAVLAAAFKGTGKPYQHLVAEVARAYTPSELVTVLALPTAAAALDRNLEAGPDRASWLVEQLKDTTFPAEAEGVDLEDLPRIKLKDGTQWKPASDLSTGQKCTAILPILLLESDRPLLVDQPEDNLDNAFVFETVVSRLREVKAARQLILVTHNPNIPVLGDASKVFVLRSDGQHARVMAQGSVNEVREEVARILEGGRAAFEARRERYGY